MNQVTNAPSENRASGAALGFVVASVLFIGLGVLVELAVRPPAIDADQAEHRYQALAELRAVENTALNNPGWIDSNGASSPAD